MCLETQATIDSPSNRQWIVGSEKKTGCVDIKIDNKCAEENDVCSGMIDASILWESPSMAAIKRK